MTKLQTALLNIYSARNDGATGLAFNVRVEGDDGKKESKRLEKEIAEIDDAQISHLIEYSTRLYNDRFNSWAGKNGKLPEGLEVLDHEHAFPFFFEKILGKEVVRSGRTEELVPSAEKQAVTEYVTGRLTIPKFAAVYKSVWTIKTKDGKTRTRQKPKSRNDLKECLGAMTEGKLSPVAWAKVEKEVTKSIKAIEDSRLKAQDSFAEEGGIEDMF